MTSGLLFIAIVPIVADRRAGGQLPRGAGLHQISRIPAPVYIRDAHREYSTLKHILVDGAYREEVIDDIRAKTSFEIEVVKRPDERRGFVLLKRGWVVERTNSWFGKFRILSKEYERPFESSRADVFLAMTMLMARRLTTPPEAHKERRQACGAPSEIEAPLDRCRGYTCEDASRDLRSPRMSSLLPGPPPSRDTPWPVYAHPKPGRALFHRPFGMPWTALSAVSEGQERHAQNPSASM